MSALSDRQFFPQGITVSLMAGAIYLFLVAPILIIVPVSFGNPVELVFPPTQFSIDSYKEFFFSSNWVEVTGRSFQIALLTTVVSMLVGVPGSYALVRMDFPGKQLVTMFLLSPILVPIVVIALGLYFYLSKLHISGTLLGLVLAHSIYVVPFVIITLNSGIRQLDEKLETVATIMGASRLRVFIVVVLPQLIPSLIAAALFAFLMSFDEVVLSWFISSAATMTLPVKMYSSIQWETSPVLAAVATILTLVSVSICLVGIYLTRSLNTSSGHH